MEADGVRPKKMQRSMSFVEWGEEKEEKKGGGGVAPYVRPIPEVKQNEAKRACAESASKA